MLEANLKIAAERKIWQNGIALYIGIPGERGQFSVARPLEFVAHSEPFAPCEPVVVLSFDDAQKIVDELWLCGIRPSEGTGSAGSLAATERHLLDMQSIAKGALAHIGIATPEAPTK